MQQPDYYYQYSQNPNPNPNPTDHYPPNTTFPPPLYSSTASAPPYTTNYSAPPPSTEYTSYPPFPQIPDPASIISPTAPSYAQPSGFPQFESHAPYQPQPPPQPQPQSYYHQTTSNYPPPSSLSPNLNNPSSNYQYNPYENSNPYESTAPKFDQVGGGGYADDYSGGYGGYGRSVSDSGPDLYGGASRYDSGAYGGGDGVYAYQGSKVEPYGSRGTGSKSSTWKDNNQQVMFDDFGRPIGLPSGNGKVQSSGLPKIVKAVPKADTQQDGKGGGVQKFRVKLLAESGSQSPTDVLCQIGLDGIRMLDPSTSRTLRIYPLDTITRCEVIDSSTFTFWSKSSVDIDARRIRLQSNSYTTNTLLDTVTAATVQLKEMGGRSRPAEPVKVTEQPTDKKKGLGDWMNIIKPVNEEKDHWLAFCEG